MAKYVSQGLPLPDAVLRALLDARSRLVILPLQDIFGWRDRINTPARVDDENWTWRLPWPVDRLQALEITSDRARVIAEWVEAAGRLRL